ncbi:S8 family serine peptidase [Rossellomorea aquimaris]|uniref:S8 family serine peptidase n=1 Tax=Rossellomorea aquimaris TaxID=189382 RepID=A0A5D4TQP9_9BACI|nr:S8 family serine peptidase [Rossellomorea aquimaris]TYS76732.1 S8 family serine peptidase [Rossellomorea aquimaris]TYS83637.1 S8 family serine peptidase [Rossellomorea aquimaris]
MNGKRYSKILTVALAASLLGSSGIPFNVMAESKPELTRVKDVEKVLSNLTDAQRKALQQIEAKPDFEIAPNINTETDGLVDVIVEFKQAPAKVEVMKQAAKGLRATTKTADSKVEKAHSEFKKSFNSLKNKKSAGHQLKEAKITKEYRNAINGVAMSIPGTEIESLLDTGVVKRIWKDEVVQLDLPNNEEASSTSKMMDSIPQINVDKLHDENVKGDGIKVAVLDTGVDYHHPDLQDAYKGGYDFIDNDSDPMETTYEDWKESGEPEINPSSGTAYYTEHGTHVSGTIAGDQKNTVDYAVKGVAPNVDLYGYRVLGPYGSGTSTSVLSGIEQAVADGMDVMNLSLGASTNDPLYPTSVAVNNAMLSGVVAVVAAGNNGPDEKTLGAPGAAALGITVGASDFAMDVANFESISVDGESFKDVLLLGKNFTNDLASLQNQSKEVVFAGLGYEADFEGKDFTGKIALIQRGELTFVDKMKHAKEAGAEAVIIYNNVDGDIQAYLGEGAEYIPAFRMTKADGERLKGLGDNATLTFGNLASIQTEGDNLAGFSSRGPVNGSYDIKPDVVAPGVAIFSTIPEYINSPEEGEDYSNAYARLQGTSMATPHVAGVVALLLQEHPEYTPFDVKAALMNTAEDLNGDVSVFEQGAGRVDAYDAVHGDVSIKVIDRTENLNENGEVVEIDEETASISFGSHYKTGKGVEENSKVTIENNGEEEKSFKVEVEYHGDRAGIRDSVENGIHLNLPTSVVVSGGNSKEISPTITVPENAEEGRYEGYIHLTNASDSSETYQVPFAIRVTEKGFEYLETDRPALANNTPKWQYYNPLLTAAFQMKSPLTKIDIVVKDGQTGDAIGFVASIADAAAKPDFRYYIPGVFSGIVYPFSDDKQNPISDQPIDLPEGDYDLGFIGHDEEGKTYSVDTPVFIDNTKPEVAFDKSPDVYEISEDMYTEEFGKEAFWIHGNVQDETVSALQSKGLDYDQSSNKFLIATGTREYFNCCFPPADSEGDTEFGIEPSDIADGPLKLSLAATDIAANVNYQRYIFLQEGTEYLTSDYNKKEVKLGDTVTMTLSLNNVKNLVSGEYTVEFKGEQYSFESVELHDSVENYAEENGLEVLLQEPEVNNSGFNGTVKVGASLNGEDFTGLNEDMPFLDVTFKVIKDKWFYRNDKLNVTTSNYRKAGESQPVSLPYYSTSYFDFISEHSEIEGYLKPEAFLKPGSTTLPYGVASEIGAEVYALSPDGEKYEGTIDSRGKYSISGVPADGRKYNVIVDVPGHLKTSTSFISGYSLKGNHYGKFISTGYKINIAGDVDGNSMIDIRDAIISIFSYGKEGVGVNKGDINQDGKVDETDLRFIEKNFLEKGPDAKKNKKPKEKHGKVTLEKLFRSIGLELEG